MKKRLVAIVLAALMCAALLPVTVGASTKHPLIVDEVGVLSEKEMKKLTAYAEDISDEYDCEVSVVFVTDTGNKGITAFADDYYDYNGYGAGPDDDGIMLVVSVGERKYWITTHSYAIKVFTDSRLESVEDSFVPELSRGNWGDGAEAFLESCEYYLDQGIPVKKLSPMALPISIILGLLLGFVPVSAMKGQMKPVAQRTAAVEYIPDGGVNIPVREDRFLYMTQTRRKIEQKSSSGGSSTHISSSGRTHGGSGGRF